jgi:pimeloyl-ACP methyl ester carboxylesterase
MSTLTINNGKIIRYELLEGDLSKPYLVFLHEGLGCVEMWRDFPKHLCEKTNCPGLVYDRIGYGKSSLQTTMRDIGYIHDYALTELPQVIEALIPQKDHILIGHSDGASIALIYGTKCFPQLKGLAVEAAHVFVEKETIRGVRLADEAYERNGPRRLLKYHGDKTHTVFKSWADTWLSEWFREWNIEALLPSISCPVLITQGEDDEFATLKQVDAITRRITGNAVSHILKNCGHTPHREHPGIMLDILSRFIRSSSV